LSVGSPACRGAQRGEQKLEMRTTEEQPNTGKPDTAQQSTEKQGAEVESKKSRQEKDAA